MKSPLTTSLRKQTPINKKAIPYMTVNKSNFTYMKNLKTFSLAIAMLISFLSFGQEKTITGVVSDAGGTLPGANVVVQGTTRGVSTNIDGKYSIKASVGETLVFSFFGLLDQDKVVGSSNIINIKLFDEVQLKEEVIVRSTSIKKNKESTTKK